MLRALRNQIKIYSLRRPSANSRKIGKRALATISIVSATTAFVTLNAK